jgi:hypothetical protein
MEVGQFEIRELLIGGECDQCAWVGPCGDMDVATRACTWMCTFWRVPPERTGRILRHTINQKSNTLQTRLDGESTPFLYLT